MLTVTEPREEQRVDVDMVFPGSESQMRLVLVSIIHTGTLTQMH